MSKAKNKKSLDEVVNQCDCCEKLHECESEGWTACPFDEGSYTLQDVQNMIHETFGWFMMDRKKFSREQIESLRTNTIHYLRELADLVEGDCMPLAWEGSYYEDGYTEQDIVLRATLDGIEKPDREMN